MKETRALWDSYHRDRSRRGRERLIIHYLGLVKYVAGRLAAGLPESVDINDLVGAGMLGLMKAVEAYDPAKEVKFETYSMPRIRGAMLDELRNQDWFPRSIRRKAKRIDNAVRYLEGALGRAPRDTELAKHMRLDLHDFYKLVGDVSKSSLLSIEEDLRVGKDGTYTSVRDILADAKVPDAYQELADRELRAIVIDTLDNLDQKEKLVLTLYYFEELTLAEIGEVLGVSESRVCQIHGKAIHRLKMRVRQKIRENPLPVIKRQRRKEALGHR
ncbi:MAG: FliA/WhiG family RNA polymerase sigma factor [bacterium]|nr:FliA/WhiG family RNA polymerase sigma factor [bacterium]